MLLHEVEILLGILAGCNILFISIYFLVLVVKVMAVVWGSGRVTSGHADLSLWSQTGSCCLDHVLKVIFLLEARPSSQSEVLSHQIFKYFPAFSFPSKTGLCSSRYQTPPHHHAATTGLHRRDAIGHAAFSNYDDWT